MCNPTNRILLLEDDDGDAALLVRVLENEGYAVTLAQRGDTGLELARKQEFDTVVTDLRMPGLTGMQVVRELHSARPRLPIILMTAFTTTETAIEATKVGAFDYLVKPFDTGGFVRLVVKAVEAARLKREAVEPGKATSRGEAIVGQSRAMQEVYKEIGRVAAQPVTVLIRGETGTGKELVARALCQHSDRAEKPFIAVNCAAIPETLLESELFGHERGAFTGAENRRIGRFEQADRGTLFLDEVGDMSMFTQAKLLRVLQEHTIQRVGGRETISVDVRVIAATHAPLERSIQEGTFRADLFYRLSAFVLHLPPLRERVDDIPALARYLARQLAEEMHQQPAAILPAALELLQQQPWPGNVRQLSNVLRQAMLEARGFPVGVEHIRTALGRGQRTFASEAPTFEALVDRLIHQAQAGKDVTVLTSALEAAERVVLRRTLDAARQTESQAAHWLRMTPSELRVRLGRLKPDPEA